MPAYKLSPGYDWNPFYNFPRNLPCPCGSKKKFKKCCLQKLRRTIKLKS